ncbi:regulator of chromosome condensation 1/beta-lactamase-inhibitor protein II [Mariannaea sp. PMI_226]|nr:regulator of chromosome condensation 1/beta-lactamase-inhibitor protein II [Mariannaea sp. PMI_226]
MPPKKKRSVKNQPAATTNGPIPSTGTPPKTKTKTKHAREDDHAGKQDTKRTKASSTVKKEKGKTTKPKHPQLPIINHPPTAVLTVIVFGNGEAGELGLGPDETETLRPRVNDFLDPRDPSKFHIVQLDCGGMHTVALTIDNQILTWGVNDKGALGRDTAWVGALRDIDDDASDASGDLNPCESTPTQIPEDSFPPGTIFTQVAAGDSCSFALTNTGLVYGWGTFRNAEGKDQFSLDSNGTVIELELKPVLIAGLNNIIQITCGANHALALDAAGDIWAYGAGEQNQLGRRLLGRRRLECLVPTRVGVCRRDAKFIGSGEYHSFAIDNKDNVWAWGLNSFGEAGYAKAAGSDSVVLPYPMKVRDLCGANVVSIDGGAHHSTAVTTDGQCFAWGRMDCGQLGIDFTSDQLDDSSIIRYDDRGKPRICLRPTVIPHIGKVVHASCGSDHTIFITQDGKAYTTGFGSSGQLGTGSDDDVQVARRIGGKATKERILTWAGAGGQFSVVAGPAQTQTNKRIKLT